MISRDDYWRIEQHYVIQITRNNRFYNTRKKLQTKTQGHFAKMNDLNDYAFYIKPPLSVWNIANTQSLNPIYLRAMIELMTNIHRKKLTVFLVHHIFDNKNLIMEES